MKRDGGFACRVCGKVLPTKRGLAGHLMFKHGDELFGVEDRGPASAPVGRLALLKRRVLAWCGHGGGQRDE